MKKILVFLVLLASLTGYAQNTMPNYLMNLEDEYATNYSNLYGKLSALESKLYNEQTKFASINNLTTFTNQYYNDIEVALPQTVINNMQLVVNKQIDENWISANLAGSINYKTKIIELYSKINNIESEDQFGNLMVQYSRNEILQGFSNQEIIDFKNLLVVYSANFNVLKNSQIVANANLQNRGWFSALVSGVKCALGTVGGAALGGLAGAAVGTVTLPVFGTVSGAAIGVYGGAMAGAAASCF